MKGDVDSGGNAASAFFWWMAWNKSLPDELMGG
jgi:hypothetical protein